MRRRRLVRRRTGTKRPGQGSLARGARESLRLTDLLTTREGRTSAIVGEGGAGGGGGSGGVDRYEASRKVDIARGGGDGGGSGGVGGGGTGSRSYALGARTLRGLTG
ncbi:hypothetical protein MN608_07286 [Microdochium nivale]|nr:hypothetical protein MN608_07286 [Microdochium nivale]